MYEQEKVIQIVNDVPYEIVMTRKNVKRMTLRIDRQGRPCLSVPLHAKQGEIWKFLTSCGGWLEKNAGKRSFFSLPSELRSGDEVQLLGRRRPVLLEAGSSARIVFRGEDVILSMRDPADPVKAAAAYERALSDFALTLFESRLDRYIDMLPAGHPRPAVKIRKMTSRWGSANSGTNEIHLSLYLMKAPLDCIDSVVLHETVHFTHMNHSDNFYRMLLGRMPDYRERSRLLKEYARS